MLPAAWLGTAFGAAAKAAVMLLLLLLLVAGCLPVAIVGVGGIS
jgi:hypothetical protein